MRPLGRGGGAVGVGIEQFLGGIAGAGRQGVRWVAISPGRSGVTVCLSQVVDAGTDTFHDITEFPPLEPDEGSWGREIAVLTTPEEALQMAVQEPGAEPGRWVNQGIVCDEYRGFRMLV